MSLSGGRRRRDPAFFVSDARIAAEEAAQKMQDHGPLHPSMEQDLAQCVEDAITEWFEDNAWGE